MTVCPPKGSHTALNYDLMKADNDSLTDEDRDKLKETVYNAIIEPSHQDFIQVMQATVNPGNVRKTVKGFHTFPKQDENGRLEVMMSNSYGEIQTPGFGEEYDKDYYKENRNLNLEIIISGEFKASVGSGLLVVELEVDTREEEGWQEVVAYSANGPHIIHRSEHSLVYKLYEESKSWSDAEAHCKSEGGHLATVTSLEEMEVAAAAAAGVWKVWLGGSDMEMKGSWSWTDGSKWKYENWESGYGNKGDCVIMNYEGLWLADYCIYLHPVLCQFPAHQFTGKTNTTLTFSQEQLTFNSLKVVYSYQYNQKLEDSWKEQRMTGFRLKWRIDPPPLGMTVQELGGSVQTPGLGGDTFDRASYIFFFMFFIQGSYWYICSFDMCYGWLQTINLTYYFSIYVSH